MGSIRGEIGDTMTGSWCEERGAKSRAGFAIGDPGKEEGVVEWREVHSQ